MASTTTEVVLYFQCDDPEFIETVNKIRFDGVVERTTREIIELLRPVWRGGYDEGFADGYDQCNDGA